jgi:Polyphosphate kinase 2 (PPK2)
VTQSEQWTQFIIRQVDPVLQWKLLPMDLESLDKWDAYTAAKEAMIRSTDTDLAPWITIKSNDMKRARINAMRHFLSTVDYEGVLRVLLEFGRDYLRRASARSCCSWRLPIGVSPRDLSGVGGAAVSGGSGCGFGDPRSLVGQAGQVQVDVVTVDGDHDASPLRSGGEQVVEERGQQHVFAALQP